MEGVRLAQVAPPGACLVAGQPDRAVQAQEAVLLGRAVAGVDPRRAVAADAPAAAASAPHGAAPRPVALAVLVRIARVADVAEPPERGGEEEALLRVLHGSSEAQLATSYVM